MKARPANMVLLVISALALIQPSLAGVAVAGEPSSGDLAAAYTAMVAHPGDLDAAVRYARFAAAQGQVRAAIAALERVLRIDPHLDNIRLQIASLYLAENSPDLASVYARQALASPSIPAPVAAQARELLAAADQASQNAKLAIALSAGFRYDTDANQATTLGLIPVSFPFGTIELPPPARAVADWSTVAGIQLAHSYDLGLQREAAWDTNLSLFDQHFFHINAAYDLEVAGLDSGPRIDVAEVGNAVVSVRPFVSALWIGYAGQSYAAIYGGGVSAGLRTQAGWSFDLTAQGRYGQYFNSGFRPLTDLYTGAEMPISAAATYALTAATSVTAKAIYYYADAKADFYARSGPGGLLGVASRVTAGDRDVTLNALASVQQLNYRAADPFVDPENKRNDTVFVVNVGASVPVYGKISAFLQYAYTHYASTYAIYRYDDNSVSFGLRVDL